VVCKYDRSQKSFKGIVRRERRGVYYYNLQYIGMIGIVSTTDTERRYFLGQFKGPWLFKLQKLVSTFRARKRGCLV
jgi:hypothetical protein